MIPLILCVMFKLTATVSLLLRKSIIGYYLCISLIADIGYYILGLLLSDYPKPYIGYAFILFALRTFLYLMYGGLFMWFAGKIAGSNTIKQVAIILLMSIMSFAAISYPAISGLQLVKLFYVYHFICSISSLSVTLFCIRSLTFDKLSIVMLSLGGLAELIILYFLGNQYLLIQICNCILYISLLLFLLIRRRYSHLLSQ